MYTAVDNYYEFTMKTSDASMITSVVLPCTNSLQRELVEFEAIMQMK